MYDRVKVYMRLQLNLKVMLCQSDSFFNQLLQNMTSDCWGIFKCIYMKFLDPMHNLVKEIKQFVALLTLENVVVHTYKIILRMKYKLI